MTTERFDKLADMVAEARGVTCADVAEASGGDKETFWKIEVWLASKGYGPVIVAGKVSYLKTGRATRCRP